MKLSRLLLGSVTKGLPLGVALLGASVPAVGQELFFSEYIDGSGVFNRALEIYNPTESAVDTAVEEIHIEVYQDGSSSPTSTLVFGSSSGVVIAPGDAFVVVQFGADSPLIDSADRTTLGLSFDGNDAVALRRNGTIVDVIGQIGFDPGLVGWGSGDTSTQDHTLRRKPGVCAGDADGSDSFDPAPEWTGYPLDTFDGAGIHETDCEATPVESRAWGRIKAAYR